jgi:transcription antitermination factor NusG
MTPKIKSIHVQKSDTAAPFVAFGIQLEDKDVIVPLEAQHVEEIIQRLVTCLGELNKLDLSVYQRAQEAAAAKVVGVEPGQRVAIVAGAVAGRQATVVSVTTEKVTVTKVEGLLPNEQLQLLPDSVKSL